MKKEENKTFKAEELPTNENVFMRKGLDGYRVVYPWKREDGSINWFNFFTGGSWWKLLRVCIIILLIVGMSWSYARDTRTCRELISNPCVFYPNISRFCTQPDYESPFGDVDLEVNLIGEES